MLLPYSPSRCDAVFLRELTVGKSRERLLETLVDSVRAELGGGNHQHQLIIGPRGSGKTHLLALLADRLESDPGLAGHILPVPLAEEEVTSQPADLVIKILERLQGRLADQASILGRAGALANCREALHRLHSEKDDDQALALAFGTLEEIATDLDRLLVPMVENVDKALFAGYAQKESTRAQWALRKALTQTKGLMLIAAAPSLFDEVSAEKSPFYGFFRTHTLPELSAVEMLELIWRRIDVELRHGRLDAGVRRRLQTLQKDFKRRRSSLQGFLLMTGGLPRLGQLLFDLLMESDVESVLGMLDRFLDELTPYFQGRLDPQNVPQAELEVLEVLATSDRGSLSLSEITDEIRGAVRTSINNNLKRLQQRGLVRRKGRHRSPRYEVSEPLFRVWRRFRIGRSERERLLFLAEVIGAVFDQTEVQAELDALEKLDAMEKGGEGGATRKKVYELILASGGIGPETREELHLAIEESTTDEEPGSDQTPDAIGTSPGREGHLEGADPLKDFQAALPVRRVYHTLSSISEESFHALTELARYAEQEGIRTGLIRFCFAALTDPDLLLAWLPQIEGSLPASRRELLRPLRLAGEVRSGKTDPELPGESAEMKRAVQEVLEGPQVKRVAKKADLAGELLRALIDKPAAEALDAIWALRVELNRDQPENPAAVVLTGEALAACARRADTWVRKVIENANPDEEPVHELAYLLVQIDHGRKLWFELKGVLFAKISENRERSIAICLEAFLDDAHIDWLEARVHRHDDFLGAAARRTLFLLRPGRPPDPVDDDEWRHYSWAPNWWLLRHLNAGSAEAVDLIARVLRQGDDPWEIAWSFTGRFENRLSPDALDVLLDATVTRLKQELAEPSDDGGDPIRAPLRFLAKIRRKALLERLEARRGTDLEDLLTHWLCDQRGSFDRHREGKAVRVLIRIGGEGITSAAHYYLRHGQKWWEQVTGTELAVMRPDNQTADLLLQLAMSDAGDNEYPSAQEAAVSALATIGRVDLAFRGAMKWGLLLREPTADLIKGCQPSPADLLPVLLAIEDPSGPDPNAVFALGLSGSKEHVPRLHEILETSPKESEVARTCLFALRELGDRSPTSIQAFVDHLQVPDHEYAAWSALYEIHTPETLEALKGELSSLRKDRLSTSDSAVQIAANLLRVEEICRDVAEYLWTELDEHGLAFVAMGDLIGFAELERQDVDDWLLELAFANTDWGHMREGAIRALAHRGDRRAYEAACLWIDPRSPSLLLEIDTERALPELRGWVESEESVLLLSAVGEAIGLADEVSALVGWLQSPSARLREGACIAAEILPWTDELTTVLRKRLYDEDWSVRNAADLALDRIWHAREIDRIVDEIISETDTTRRWCLLDVVLEGGHPGLDGPFDRQLWVARLLEQLPLAMQQRAVDRLKNRRKKLRDKLEKRARSA